MPFTYEICGALPVREGFRRSHVRQFAERIANPAEVYFATDSVTGSLVLRIRGALSDDERVKVERTLIQFSQKWARAGAIFTRVRYGEPTFLPVGLRDHVALLDEIVDQIVPEVVS